MKFRKFKSIHYPYYYLLLGFISIFLFNIFFFDKAGLFKTALADTNEDTAKVNFLNALVRELIYKNHDTCILLSKQALEISIKNNYQKGLGTTHINLGAAYWFKGDLSIALSHYGLRACEVRDLKALRCPREQR